MLTAAEKFEACYVLERMLDALEGVGAIPVIVIGLSPERGEGGFKLAVATHPDLYMDSDAARNLFRQAAEHALAAGLIRVPPPGAEPRKF